MNKLIKRTVSFFAAASMLLSAAGAEKKQNIVNIAFDDCVTNDMSEYVDVTGPSNVRVVEDGTRNKSFAADFSYVDGNVSVTLPEHEMYKNFTVMFDMRIEGACGGGTIDFISSKETTFNAFTIDETGVLKTADDERKIVNVLGGGMNTIAVSFNNDRKIYNCYVNNKAVVSKRLFETQLSDIACISFNIGAPNVKSMLYIDNIKLYDGCEYVNRKESTVYNERSSAFEETDESGLADKVYYKNSFDSASSMSLSYVDLGNTLEWASDEDENGIQNGFMRFTKITSQGIYTYQSVGNVGKHIIVEADVRHGKKSDVPLTYILIDSESSSSRIITGPFSVYASYVKCSGVSTSIKKQKWNKISIALNFTKHTFDVYVNGVKTAKEKSLPAEMNTLSELRFQLGSVAELGSVDVDNIAIYAGSEPRDISESTIAQESRFDSNDSAAAYLRGKTAVQTYAGTIYANNQKKNMENGCINIGDESLLPEEAFETLFKTDVTVSGNDISVSGGVSFTVGEKKLVKAGKVYEIDEAPQIIDGIVYIPAVAYGNICVEDGQFDNDGHGMLITGKAVANDDNRKKQANLYLFFERKSADELKAQLEAQTDNLTAHPRLMMTKDYAAQLREEIKTDPYKKKWFEKVKKYADAYLEQPPAEYKLSGGRMLDLANSTLSRIETLGFVYQMTLDKKYGERTVRELEAIAGFKDWVPYISFLETATFSSAFALGFDWAYDCMDADTAKRLAEAAQNLGLKNAQLAYTASATFNDFWWNTETNWGIICNGGISNLALATAEYNTDECMTVLKDALRSIEYTWYRFAPDGAWHEGPG